MASDTAVREFAHEILARPEYAKYRSANVELFRELVQRLLGWLKGLQSLYDDSPVLYFALLIGLGLCLLLLVAHITWSIWVALRSAPPPPVAGAVRRELDFAAEAGALAERGAYIEAAHQLLLASLAHAARARLLELRPEDGNGRVCEELRASTIAAGLRDHLIALIQRTEATWFGSRQQSRELYEQWRSAYAELRRSSS